MSKKARRDALKALANKWIRGELHDPTPEVIELGYKLLAAKALNAKPEALDA